MIDKDDWRLRGQEDYLSGKVLYFRTWKAPKKEWDHDHCEFCWDKFSDYPDKNVFLIPTNINLDCENNYPTVTEPISANEKHTRIVRQNNAVHPNNGGYRQIGDTFYCWMKYRLFEQEKK